MQFTPDHRGGGGGVVKIFTSILPIQIEESLSNGPLWVPYSGQRREKGRFSNLQIIKLQKCGSFRKMQEIWAARWVIG